MSASPLLKPVKPLLSVPKPLEVLAVPGVVPDVSSRPEPMPRLVIEPS